jgi:hypothetical protein
MIFLAVKRCWIFAGVMLVTAFGPALAQDQSRGPSTPAGANAAHAAVAEHGMVVGQ